MLTINQNKPRILAWLKQTSPCSVAVFVWIAAIFAWEAFPKKPIDPAMYETLNPTGKLYFQPEYDILIYVAATVVACLAALFCSLWIALPAKDDVNQSGNSVDRAVGLTWYDAVALFAIIAMIWIPDGRVAVENAIRFDRLYHFDFYYMAPLQAYLHGEKLGTEFYIQYQSGWVLLFANLGSELATDYAFVLSTLSFIGGCIYATFYLLCRKLGVSRFLATIGTLATIYLQIYSLYHASHWATPQSTVLRNPFFLILALALIGCGRRPGVFYGVITGILLGLSFLFGTDTGIYSMIAVAFCTILMAWNRKKFENDHPLCGIASLWFAAIAVAFLGLFFASRGSIFEAGFWKGYFEVFYLYPAGFSARPIASAVGRSQFFPTCFFCAVFVTYIVSLAKVVARAFQVVPQPHDLAIAFLAIFGLGSLLVFVNRSYDSNLLHSCTPACLLLTVEISRIIQGIYSRLSNAGVNNYVRWVAFCALIVFAVSYRPDIAIRSYPSLLFKYAPRSPNPIELTNYSKMLESMKTIRSKIEPIVGEKSLSVSGEEPMPWLIALNLAPSGRYCPPTTITHQQDRHLVDSLDTEYVLVSKGGRLTGDYIENLIADRFDLVKTTGEYAIYRKRASSMELGKD